MPKWKKKKNFIEQGQGTQGEEKKKAFWYYTVIELVNIAKSNLKI